jgi:uncharacterized damage-inducible protein DinB
MTRTAIQLLGRSLETAYRGDSWHALLQSLRPITREHWFARPAEFNVEVFGDDPELSIADTVLHVGAAKRMYANRAFGDGTAQWGALELPRSREFDDVLAWLDAGHRLLVEGLAALQDDTALQGPRTAHWGEAIPIQRFVEIMINHDLYHSGEINRQLSLLRGTSGAWTMPGR